MKKLLTIPVKKLLDICIQDAFEQVVVGNIFAYILPKVFNSIKVRTIRRQKFKCYIIRLFLNKLPYSIRMMIADIIQKEYHLLVYIMFGQLILKKTQSFQSFRSSLLNKVLLLF